MPLKAYTYIFPCRWQEIVDNISQDNLSTPPSFAASSPQPHAGGPWVENPRRSDGHGVGQSGMVFDYIYHGFPSHTEPGPQVVELILLGAGISWPYLLDSSFCTSISTIFTRYFWQSCCPAHPPQPLAPWVYINVILENSCANPTVPITVGNFIPSTPGRKQQCCRSTFSDQYHGLHLVLLDSGFS